MNRQYLDAVTRQLATSRSRRHVLATAGRGVVGGVGAATIARGFDLGLFDDPAPSASAQGVTVSMLDFRYEPETITVPVGTEVTWVNNGIEPHTATSNPAGTVNTGIVNPGAAGSHTFTAPGTVNYFCQVHGEDMAGTVVVEDTPTPTQPTLFQRRSLHNLGAGDTTLDSYAAAIGAMKDWDVDADANNFARSWRYQGNIHMTWDTLVDPAAPEPPTPDPLPPGWSTCEHGFGELDGYTPYFWPWHRMYLYWFERIVRQLSGDADFALPYWDTFVAANRTPPAPFLDESSHLFAPGRILDPMEPASSFDPCLGITSDNYDDAAGRIEGTPHGQVHVWIGGLMALPWVAARDPLFWLHHANIDRLWESWVALGNSNPGDTTWLENDMNAGNNMPFGVARPYHFFDEAGNQATSVRVVKEVLTSAMLGYEYDALFGSEVCPEFLLAPIIDEAAAAATPAATPEAALELGSNAPPGGIDVGPSVASVPVPVSQPESAAAIVAGGGATVLTLEGIRGTGVPSVTVEVYINLPADQRENPDYRSPYYVGNLNLFGVLIPHAPEMADRGNTQRFNISRNVAALAGGQEWTSDAEVILVPYYSGTPAAAVEGAASPEAATPPEGPWITVESVVITAR